MNADHVAIPQGKGPLKINLHADVHICYEKEYRETLSRISHLQAKEIY